MIPFLLLGCLEILHVDTPGAAAACSACCSLLGEAEERAFPPPTARTPKTQQVTAPAVAT